MEAGGAGAHRGTPRLPREFRESVASPWHRPPLMLVNAAPAHAAAGRRVSVLRGTREEGQLTQGLSHTVHHNSGARRVGPFSVPRSLAATPVKKDISAVSGAAGLPLAVAGADEEREVGHCVLPGVHPASSDDRGGTRRNKRATADNRTFLSGHGGCREGDPT